jgi:transposase
MSRFPTPGHLVSWARFAPGVKESAGRRKGNATTGHGNPYLARVLGDGLHAWFGTSFELTWVHNGWVDPPHRSQA